MRSRVDIEFACPFDGCLLSLPVEAIGTRIIHDGCGASLHVPFSLASSKTILNQAIQRSWLKLIDDCGASPTGQIEVFAHLLWAYSGSDRHYHNLTHIHSMFDFINYQTNDGMGKPISITTVELATWFHDFVYDTHSHENEFRSAQFAFESLKGLGVDEARSRRVSDLVLMTANHIAPEGDAEAWLFLDADLSVLAGSPSEYTKYAEAIREEYSWVDEKVFLEGRKRVLIKFLARPKIYNCQLVHESYDTKACANIAAEIAEIDAKLRTLA